MKKPKQETLLPERKARGNVWKKIHALPPDRQLEAARTLAADIRAHPDFANKVLIEAALQELHLRPELQTSPELIRLIFVFRELLADFVPGETAEQALEPLQTIYSRRGGGAKPAHDPEEVRRFHARLVAAGATDATSKTAVRFGFESTRRVRQILKG